MATKYKYNHGNIVLNQENEDNIRDFIKENNFKITFKRNPDFKLYIDGIPAPACYARFTAKARKAGLYLDRHHPHKWKETLYEFATNEDYHIFDWLDQFWGKEKFQVREIYDDYKEWLKETYPEYTVPDRKTVGRILTDSDLFDVQYTNHFEKINEYRWKDL